MTHMYPISGGPQPSPVPGKSTSLPMYLDSSVMYAWQKRWISVSLLLYGLKSHPPNAPPMFCT